MRKVLVSTVLAAVAASLALTAPEAESSARIEVDGVVLTADARFAPVQLSARRFAPATITARAGFGAHRPGLDTALTEMRVNLGGRYVRIDPRGLPVCRAELLIDTTPGEARRHCGPALVAVGRVGVRADRPDGSLAANVPLLVFNGPRQDGRPTIVSHVHGALPEPETVVVTAPLRVNRAGLGGFSFEVEIPRFAEGHGYVTSIAARIGRAFRHRGQRRSYVNARCPWSMLPIVGRFTFAHGTIIHGNLNKFCLPRR